LKPTSLCSVPSGSPARCSIGLTHHVYILEMSGDSYRLNQSKRRLRRASSETPVDSPTQA
jgi:hypothetical protein